MPNAEMTMSEMLHDPMIRQMLRADRVSLADFAVLLKNAATRRSKRSAVVWPALPECLLQYSTAQATLVQQTRVMLKLC